MKTLSIVVPCFNEEANLLLILNCFAKVIKRDDIEVILVDNGSTDNTAATLKRLLPGYPFARAITVPANIGYGHGILSGLKCATGQYLAWTHADMQTSPEDVLKALDIIIRSANPERTYIKGRRKGRAWMDSFFTLGMSLFETIYLRRRLFDINAQPNLFHRRFYQTWADAPNDFSLDLYVYYTALVSGLKIIRFNVIFPPRIHGQSSWNHNIAAKLKFIRRTLSFSKSLKQRLSLKGPI